MNVRLQSTLLLCAVLAISCGRPFAAESAPESGAGRVDVAYIHPDKFADVGERYYGRDASRQAYLDDFARHIRARAEAYVAEGQHLSITVSEIDMAGGFEPGRRYFGYGRIVRDVYPPRIDLAFKLTGADGALVKRGERKLRDPTVIGRPTPRSNDALRYEKALFDDWLERELDARASSAGG